MKHSWVEKFKLLISSKYTDEDVRRLILEARNDERTYNDGLASEKAVGFEDTFYQFRESYTEKDQKWVESKLEKKRVKDLNEADRNKVVSIIASTGWAPINLESAAFRIGTTDELSIIQDACFKKYLIDPLGRSIVKNYVYFVIGKGVKVNSIVPEVSDWIIEFRKLNKLDAREKKMVSSQYVEGEYFLKYILDGTDVHLRKVKPSSVINITTRPDDLESIINYKIEKSDGESYLAKDVGLIGKEVKLNTNNTEVSGKYIQFIKTGEEEYLRGSPLMYPILRYLKYYEDWLIDRMRLNHERAKVVWIKSVSGNKNRVKTNPFSAPKGGIMLEEDTNIKYRIEAAKLEAGDAKDDGLNILYMIGSGVNMPIHVLNQRTSEQVYASIRKADSPFSQMIEEAQEFWRWEWDMMYRNAMNLSGKFKDKKFKIPIYDEEVKIKAMKVINEMIIDGKSEEVILKELEEVKNNVRYKEVGVDGVPINQVFPQVVQENSQELAGVLKIHKEIGIVSDQTASERAGYSWQQELTRGLRNKDPKKDEKSEKSEKSETGNEE